MYEGVLTSDLSKRILLGDTDSIDDRLCQVEMKIQKLEAKSHAEIQNLSNTIHVLQQKGKFLYLNTLSRQLTFKKYSEGKIRNRKFKKGKQCNGQ